MGHNMEEHTWSAFTPSLQEQLQTAICVLKWAFPFRTTVMEGKKQTLDTASVDKPSHTSFDLNCMQVPNKGLVMITLIRTRMVMVMTPT